MSQSILITGCSSGIGLDAARTLHARGWHVFASCRQQKDVERLATEGMNSLLLDHDDSDSIKEASAAVLEQTGGTLDAVFANGAYAIPGRVEDLPATPCALYSRPICSALLNSSTLFCLPCVALTMAEVADAWFCAHRFSVSLRCRGAGRITPPNLLWKDLQTHCGLS